MNFGLFGTPLALLAGDFDGDGLRDLLVVSSSGIFVLHNESPPTIPLHINASVRFDSPLGHGSGTLTWTTNAERDLLGFNAIEIVDGVRRQINRTLVPCFGCADGRGYAYTTIVPKHHSGRSFYIEAVHADHTIETFGPARKE